MHGCNFPVLYQWLNQEKLAKSRHTIKARRIVRQIKICNTVGSLQSLNMILADDVVMASVLVSVMLANTK